jgi:FMN phosphatase YigB (HAD superfamily)
MNDLRKYTHIIFDLDNTLYDECHYLFGGYQEIGFFLQKTYSLEPDQITASLIEWYMHQGRHQLFQRLCEKFNLPKKIIPQLLHILRTVSFSQPIELYPWAQRLLPQLISAEKKLYVITNGTPTQQQNKINHLNWGEMSTHIQFILANEYAAKPNSNSFLLTKIPTSEKGHTVFIGDSEVDMEFAQNTGIHFIHVSKVEC